MTGTGTPIQMITKGEGRRPVSRVRSLKLASHTFIRVLRGDAADDSTAADDAQASRARDRGLNRACGFDPAGPQQPVRHLVIFPAPVL